MGEARRRRLAGDPPRGYQKSRKITRKRQLDIFDELTGGGTMAGIMSLLMAAKYRRGLMLTRKGGKGE